MIENITVLIAEDEEELREYIGEYVALFFKNVILAKCGHDAYIKYLDKHPDIIIADINMPNLDGLSLIKRIRERDKETKIIIMSAYSEQEKLLMAIKLNLISYLIKPIKTDELKAILLDIVDDINRNSNKIYFNKDSYWDKKNRSFFHKDKELTLNEREVMVIELLCSKINQAFSAENIFYHIYTNQDEKEFSQYAVTSLIKRLRAKIHDDIIQNEYGSGYKIVKKI